MGSASINVGWYNVQRFQGTCVGEKLLRQVPNNGVLHSAVCVETANSHRERCIYFAEPKGARKSRATYKCLRPVA